MRFLYVLMFSMLLTVVSGVSVASAQSVDIVAVELYKPPFDGEPYRMHPSVRDYSKVAAEITDTCSDDFSKLCSIYEWLCDHIDYDMTYSIHQADSCFQTGRGVCQAYCELFYHIARAAKLKVEIVSGLTKSPDGQISPRGHTWLFAYTRKNRGLLLDPTWGSGHVVDGIYRKNPDKWNWFGVSPEWMLLTHYPDSAHYQLVDSVLTFDEFRAMPYVNPLFRTYGVDEQILFRKARANDLSMPVFYNMGEGVFQLIDIPLSSSLKIGETYTFRVRMNNDRAFGIVNNPVLIDKPAWKDEGGGVYSVEFMPRSTSNVIFSLKDTTVDTRWNYMVEYTVDAPSDADWAKVERVYPLSVPAVAAVENLNAASWQRCGLDGHQLLRLIREQRVTSLPVIYKDKGQRFEVVDVPMNRRLKAGQRYTFRFRFRNGKKWALVANRETWHSEWQVDASGVHTLTVAPAAPGPLELCVDLDGSGSFLTCLGYVVE